MKKLLILIFSLIAFVSYGQQQFTYAGHSTSVTDTYTVLITNLTSYGTTRGVVLDVLFDTSSSGACTLNVNGIGAITINGSITANKVYRLAYNTSTSQFDIVGGSGIVTLQDVITEDPTLTTDNTISTGTNFLAIGSTNGLIKFGDTFGFSYASSSDSASIVAPLIKFKAGNVYQTFNSASGDFSQVVNGVGESSLIYQLGSRVTMSSFLSSETNSIQVWGDHLEALSTNGALNIKVQELQLDDSPGTTGQVLQSNGPGVPPTWETLAGGGSGTVTSVSVVTANGVSGSVATATTTPAITLTLGAITPTSVAASGAVSGSNLSGTNTGDNAVNTLYSGLVSNATHTGDATGATALTLATVNSNVGSFGSATAAPVFTVNGKGLITAASSSTITPAVGSITGLGSGVGTWLATPSWTNFNSAITGTAPYYSLFSGGTLTGTNTITSNARNQINYAGTFTATTNNDYTSQFGGTYTAMGGANTFSAWKFNPSLVASGTGGTQVNVDINGSFSGGTSPVNIDLRVVGKTLLGGTTLGNYTGSLFVGTTSNKNALLGNIEFTTSGGPSYSGVGFQSAGAGNRTLEIYGANLSSASDVAAIKFSSFSMSAARTGASLSLWNIPHSNYTPATFTATDLAMLRLDGSWPTLTTPLSVQYGIDINPNNAGNGTTNIALRTGTLAGSVLINGTTITASTQVDIRGRGTTSSTINTRLANSSNTLIAHFLDNGETYQLGKRTLDFTYTTPGTTGNQTINKPFGSVNIAAAGTSVVVTSSWCTANSRPYAWVGTNDATAFVKSTVNNGDGTFTIYLGAAATGEVVINFEIIN